MESIKEVSEVGIYDNISDLFYDLSAFSQGGFGDLTKINLYLNEAKNEINGIELFYSENSTGIFQNPSSKIISENKIEINLQKICLIYGSYFSNKITKLIFRDENNTEVGFNSEDKYNNFKMKLFKMTITKEEKLIGFKVAFNTNLVYFAKLTKSLKNEDEISKLEGKNYFASNFYGKQFNDTIMQNIDYSEFINQEYRITQIQIYHDGGLVYGTKISYLFSNGQSKDIQFGKASNMFETLNLEEGEIISKIIIRSGDLIDGLTVITNRDNAAIAGGNGGGVHIFDLEQLKKEKNINSFIGFDGGFTGLLHRIRVSFK